MSTLPSDATPPAKNATPAAKNVAPTVAAGNRPPAAGQQKGSYAVVLGAIAVLALIVIAMPRRGAVPAPGAFDLKPAGQETAIEQPIDGDSAQSTAAAPAAQPSSTAAATVTPSAAVAAPRTQSQPAKRTPPAQQLNPSAAKPTTQLASAAPTGVPTPRGSETPDDLVVDTRPARLESEAAAIASPSASAAALTTVTGCLEVAANHDRFRLTDTEGDNVPKTRNWRSGFLKKRSAAIALVGDANALGLNRQVGKRVAATGVQTSRELKVSSVQVVSPFCD